MLVIISFIVTEEIYGSEATYTCNKGYVIEGTNSKTQQVICTSTANWSPGNLSACVPIVCPQRLAILNGT